MESFRADWGIRLLLIINIISINYARLLDGCMRVIRSIYFPAILFLVFMLIQLHCFNGFRYLIITMYIAQTQCVRLAAVQM